MHHSVLLNRKVSLCILHELLKPIIWISKAIDTAGF